MLDPLNAILVTGPSGAGRSTAIRALEDLGYEAIDNMPLSLVPHLLSGPSNGRDVALGIDVRTRDFSAQAVLDMAVSFLSDTNYRCSILYLDCSGDILLRRYSETRRRHPLSPDETPLKGIEREQEILADLRVHADVLIDTSKLSPHDLKAEMSRLFVADSGDGLSVSLHSFSYKRGVPRGIDMTLDCRFLRNPYWDERLRELNGRDDAVQKYVRADPRYQAFFDQLVAMMDLLLPAYRDEGKSYFSVGLGCTGGQHRSVSVAEDLSKTLAERGWQVSIRHREMERGAGADVP